MWRDSMFIENGLGRLLHHLQWGIPARTPPAEVIGNMRHSEGMPCGYGVFSLHIMRARVAQRGYNVRRTEPWKIAFLQRRDMRWRAVESIDVPNYFFVCHRQPESSPPCLGPDLALSSDAYTHKPFSGCHRSPGPQLAMPRLIKPATVSAEFLSLAKLFSPCTPTSSGLFRGPPSTARHGQDDCTELCIL